MTAGWQRREAVVVAVAVVVLLLVCAAAPALALPSKPYVKHEKDRTSHSLLVRWKADSEMEAFSATEHVMYRLQQSFKSSSLVGNKDGWSDWADAAYTGTTKALCTDLLANTEYRFRLRSEIVGVQSEWLQSRGHFYTLNDIFSGALAHASDTVARGTGDMGDRSYAWAYKRRFDSMLGEYAVPSLFNRFADADTGLVHCLGGSYSVTAMNLVELNQCAQELVGDSAYSIFEDEKLYDADGYECEGMCYGDDCHCAALVDGGAFDALRMGQNPTEVEDHEAHTYRSAGIAAIDMSSVPMVNSNGVTQGEPRFRLLDEDVDDVYYLEAREFDHHEVHGGRAESIWGWRGGKVEGAVIDAATGALLDGTIVVGPYPATDVNDRVQYGEKRFGAHGKGNSEADRLDDSPFSDLEVTSPGPVLTFGKDRRVRVYAHNAMMEQSLSVHWHGLDVPIDQDGVSHVTQLPIEAGGGFVYEFLVPATGTYMYHSHDNTPTAMDNGLTGDIISAEKNTFGTHDRAYVSHVHDGWGRFSINGRVFPGTLRGLGGWFRDQLTIATVESDGADMVVTIVDERRAEPEASDSECPIAQRYNDPASGAPITAGTGYVDEDDQHVNGGHNIISTGTSGVQVLIEGVESVSGGGGSCSVNGVHFVTNVDDTYTKLRIRGHNCSAGTGGALYVYRKHKASREEPTLQNNGAYGAYYKLNENENVKMHWINGASMPHPIHTHGHQMQLTEISGHSLGNAELTNTFHVDVGNTMAGIIHAGNPNCVGAFLIHCHIGIHLENPDQPWPGAPQYPGGMLGMIDYTGDVQGYRAIDDGGHLEVMVNVPPSCDAGADIVITSDRVDGIDSTSASLAVTANFLSNGATGESYGELTSVSWSATSVPNGATPVIIAPGELNTDVLGLSVAGEYMFEVTVTGVNTVHGMQSNVSCIVSADVIVEDTYSSNTAVMSYAGMWPETNDGAQGHVTFALYNGTLSTSSFDVTGAPDGRVGASTFVTHGPTDSGAFVATNDEVTIKRATSYAGVDASGSYVKSYVINDDAAYGHYATVSMLDGSLGGTTVYFVVTETSDEALSAMLGAAFSPYLALAADDIVNWDTTFDGTWTFTEVPPFVGGGVAADASTTYSPIKRFEYGGSIVTAVVNMVRWGDADNERLVQDVGGHSPLIRANPPSDIAVGHNETAGDASEAHGRQRGGVVLAVDTDAMEVTVKLFRARVDGADSYYTLFSSSDFSTAGYYGVPHVPMLRDGGAAGGAVHSAYMFGNGEAGAGGDAGFGAALFSTTPVRADYSALTYVRWLLFNCGEVNGWKTDNVIGDNPLYNSERNIAEGGVPSAGVATFDSARPLLYDPFQLNGAVKANACPRYVARVSDGCTIEFGDVAALVADGVLFETESPLGASLGWAGFEVMVAPTLVVDARDDRTNFVPEDTWAMVDSASGARIASHESTATELPLDGWTAAADDSTFAISLDNEADSVSDTAYFLSEVSDETLSESLGVAHNPALARLDAAVVDESVAVNAVWLAAGNANGIECFVSPGTVGTAAAAPVGNAHYTPFKRVSIDGKDVTFNMHLVSWGTEAGQQLTTDAGDCSDTICAGEYISDSEASGGWTTGGPWGCTGQAWSERYRGGEVLAMSATSVTLKMHNAISATGMQTYYIHTEASSNWEAGYLGVVHAPLLADAAGESNPLYVFGNGKSGAGMLGFQTNVVTVDRSGSAYSSLLSVRTLYHNCVDEPSSTFEPADFCDAFHSGYNAGVDSTYFPNITDIFQLSPAGVKGAECPVYAAWLYDGDDGYESQIAAGRLLETSYPGGAPLNSDYSLVLNAPVVATFAQAVADDSGPVVPLSDRVVNIIGTNSGKFWSVQIDGGDIVEVSPGELSDFAEDPDSLYTINVRRGDTLVSENQSSTNGHGIVFLSLYEALSSRDAFDYVFELNPDQPVEMLEDASATWTDAFGVTAYGTDTFYGTALLSARVRGNAPIGSKILFSCTLHGSNRMNGILYVEA